MTRRRTVWFIVSFFVAAGIRQSAKQYMGGSSRKFWVIAEDDRASASLRLTGRATIF